MTEQEELEQIISMMEKLKIKNVKVLNYVLKEHKCERQHVCCKTYFCNACFLLHIKTIHSKEEILFQEFLDEQASLLVEKNDIYREEEREAKKEEPKESKNISATSKGRVKCCGKFRSQQVHEMHRKKMHPVRVLIEKKRKRNEREEEFSFANMSKEEMKEIRKFLQERGEI